MSQKICRKKIDASKQVIGTFNAWLLVIIISFNLKNQCVMQKM